MSLSPEAWSLMVAIAGPRRDRSHVDALPHSLNRLAPHLRRQREAWCINNPTPLELWLEEHPPETDRVPHVRR